MRSDAWWNAEGNRLLYAERFPTTDGLDSATEYVVSQADQPVGIASKSISDAATLPALSADGAQVARINARGDLLLGAPGTSGQKLASGVLRQLPDTSRVGRILWRPRTGDLLYATAENNAIQLVLRAGNGATRALGTVTGMLDACFSPDGKWLLIRTTERFTVWDVRSPGSARYEWANSDQTAIPYWSPDSNRLLVFDAAGATLVDLDRKVTSRALYYAQPYQARQGAPHWRPASGSPGVPMAPASPSWLRRGIAGTERDSRRRDCMSPASARLEPEMRASLTAGQTRRHSGAISTHRPAFSCHPDMSDRDYARKGDHERTRIATTTSLPPIIPPVTTRRWMSKRTRLSIPPNTTRSCS